MESQRQLSTLDAATRERIARHVRGINLYILDFEDYGNNIVRFYVRPDREQDDISMYISAMFDLAGLKDYRVYFFRYDEMRVSFANKDDSELALNILRKNI